MSDGPSPFVPPEVDLTGLGFMPLKHMHVMQSTLFAKSNGDEFKAAFALWCASWSEVPAGSLPDDEEVLEFLSRSKVWPAVRARALHGWVKCSDGRLYHKVIAPLAIDAWERRSEFREVKANQDSRQKRWREKVKRLSSLLRDAGVTPPKDASLEKLVGLCAKHVPGFVDESASQSSTSASPVTSTETSPVDKAEMGKTVTVTVTGTETLEGKEKEIGDSSDSPSTKAERGMRLPREWKLPQAWGNWALEEMQYWDAEMVRKVADKFRNHWIAKPGKAGVKLDWFATWRNWCTSALTKADFPPPQTGRATETNFVRGRRERVSELTGGLASTDAPDEAGAKTKGFFDADTTARLG